LSFPGIANGFFHKVLLHASLNHSREDRITVLFRTVHEDIKPLQLQPFPSPHNIIRKPPTLQSLSQVLNKHERSTFMVLGSTTLPQSVSVIRYSDASSRKISIHDRYFPWKKTFRSG